MRHICKSWAVATMLCNQLIKNTEIKIVQQKYNEA